MTVRQLLANLDSREISEWMAYFKIEADKLPKKEQDLPVEDKIKSAMTGFGKNRMEIK